MAKLYLQEYGNISTIGGAGQGLNKVAIPSLPNVIAFNSIALTSTSASSTQLNAKTQYVRMVSDTNCWICFSQGTATATTATTTSQYLPANQIDFVAVQGSGWINATL